MATITSVIFMLFWPLVVRELKQNSHFLTYSHASPNRPEALPGQFQFQFTLGAPNFDILDFNFFID